MNFKTLDDFDFSGKKVLLRIDINAAISKNKVLDSPRFSESSKTISALLKKKAKIFIIAHQGRKGDSDFIPLKQHSKILSRHVKKKIVYVDFLFEENALKKISSLKNGEAILLKNVREYDDEKNINDPNNKYLSFSKNFDIFINDAFSVSHREQGSIIIPPKFIKSGIGLSMQKEVEALENFSFDNNASNLYFVGGSKIEDYLQIFNSLENKNSKIIASGVLANLFLISKGADLVFEKEWLKEKGFLPLLPKISEIYTKYPSQIILPVDFATGEKIRIEYDLDNFPKDQKIWDVGKKSVEIYKSHLKEAKSVFMKGPLGFSENKLFKDATVEILKEISKLTKQKKIFSLLGGGHLTTSIQEYKIPNHFSYISLSGGALIAYISGNKLPGLVALENCQIK